MLPQQLPWEMSRTTWASELNPLLVNPLNNVNILQGVVLATGTNVINHLLGRNQVGWFLTDINANVTVYRSAAFNNLTLTLTSSGVATVNIGVF